MSAKISLVATQMTAQAAAIATAAGGGLTTADITALGDFLKTLSLDNSLAIPALKKSGLTNPNTALTPG
jgi:hypothetical protein